ncbi:MAG TPA: SDR family NAD(P)-dependent oxidoreductase [Candidatus Koribacter sp.]|jgi:3-oxoacyl-[acyl-carrier protein] reductase
MSPESSPYTPLSSQVAVVTGASRGIGAAIARRLAIMGASVVLTARSTAALSRTAQSIRENGGQCEAVPCDLSNLAQVEALGRAVEKKLGRIDVLVNNAGIGNFSGKLYALAPDDWDRILNTNLRGPYYMIRTFAPMMVRANSGMIINISSLAGKNPLANGAAYAASKWGLNGLSYSLAEELRGNNIRVSVISPGSVATEFGDHSAKNQTKMLSPDDIAHAVAMLVTQAPNSFISDLNIRPTQKP